MKTNKDQRQKYTLMKRYDKIWTQIKAKTKTKSSSRKSRTLEQLRFHSYKFIERSTQMKSKATSPKENLLGSNHLLQQTNKLNQLRKLKQLTLQEKHIVHEAIKI